MFRRTAAIYCASAFLLFAILSYSAVSTKSATFDEPGHVLLSYVALRDGDLRAEPEHPPLWKYVAALPLVVGPPINPNTDTPAYRAIPIHFQSVWAWSVATLYRTPGNDADRILASARFMMLLLALTLGTMVATFAHRAAGPLAACVAATLFALDPNLLAHASLVKNDLPVAVFTTALAYSLWRTCDRITIPRILSLPLLCAACITTKFTGLLAVPIIVLSLLTRALLPTPWPSRLGTRNSELGTRRHRLLTAITLSLTCALITYIAIWAVYLFRFNPSSDPTVHYDTSQPLRLAAINDLRTTLHRNTATADEFNAWRPGPSLRLGLFALDHHLFPEPFLNGLIFSAAISVRPGYALGQLYDGGRWYYFPLAFLTKTPLTALATLLLAALTALSLRRSPQLGTRNPEARNLTLPLQR